MKRFVILRIDDLYRMLKDYAGEALGLPEDAWPTKFRSVQGKLDLLLEAESWDGEQPAEEIKFDIRRVYGVSNDGRQ
jgi:hypothetical protein